MKTNLKKQGWEKSAYDPNKIIKGSMEVAFISFGAQDRNGDKIFTQSKIKLLNWTANKIVKH
jgi:hypothetical protein